MLANLCNHTETQLLELVRMILSGSSSTLTIEEKAELLQINDEFIRRDAMRLQRMCHYCYQVILSGELGWHCPHCGAC